LSTSETVMAIHISGGSFEVQEMKEGTFFLSLALFLAFFLCSLSTGLVLCERSDARFLRRCSPSQGFEMHRKTQAKTRAEVFGPFQVEL